MAPSFDLIVIGTGMAANGAAHCCRQAGWRVAVVDDEPYGGTRPLRGCDPKKVLVAGADLVDWHRRMTGWGIAGEARIDWPALMRLKRTFTEPVPASRAAAFQQAGIATFHGVAWFAGVDRLAVAEWEGDRELKATHFLLASGAEPRRLDIPAGSAPPPRSGLREPVGLINLDHSSKIPLAQSVLQQVPLKNNRVEKLVFHLVNTIHTLTSSALPPIGPTIDPSRYSTCPGPRLTSRQA